MIGFRTFGGAQRAGPRRFRPTPRFPTFPPIRPDPGAGLLTGGPNMFRKLTPEETVQFEEHARTTLPGSSDWSVFHPVCRAIWWDLACQHDGLDPQSSFVVFSDDNPYFAEA